MKKFVTRTEEARVLQEAIDWAMESTHVIDTVHAIEWAIAEYRWNLVDEDAVDRKGIKRKIDILIAIHNRMEGIEK